MKFFYSLLNLPPTNLLAFALVIPTYITFFIGKEPLMQGLAFSLYLIPLGVAVVGKRMTLPSFKLSAFWAIFLCAWIVPSLINAYGSHLESDLVRLPVLFFHVTILTALVFIFYDFLKSDPQKQLHTLLRTMFWVMLPMALLILLKVCYIKYYQMGTPRPSPFGIHPTIAAEVMFTFLICATQARQRTMRWTGYLLAITTIFMVEGRGALISCYIVLIMTYGYPWLRKNLNSKACWVGLGSTFIIITTFPTELLVMLQKLTMFDIRSGLSGRETMWLLGLDSIMAHPWTGLGFWVNPMGYSIPEHFPFYATLNHPQWVIHNAFIRIATENGLALTAIIIGTGLGATIKLHQNKNALGLALVLAVTFYLCFATRHLTLNLMNVMLYATLLMAWMPTHSLVRTHAKRTRKKA